MIEFKPGCHYISMWFVYPPSDEHIAKHPHIPKMDWMGAVWLDENSIPQIRYRFRYYDEENPGPWNYTDRKSWQAMEGTEPKTPEDAAELRKGLDMIAGITAMRNGSEAQRIDFDADYEGTMKILEESHIPWMHKAKMPPGVDLDNIDEFMAEQHKQVKHQ